MQSKVETCCCSFETMQNGCRGFYSVTSEKEKQQKVLEKDFPVALLAGVCSRGSTWERKILLEGASQPGSLLPPGQDDQILSVKILLSSLYYHIESCYKNAFICRARGRQAACLLTCRMHDIFTTWLGSLSPVTSSPDPLQNKAGPTVTGVTVYWQDRQTMCTQFVVNTPFSVPTALTSTHFAW